MLTSLCLRTSNLSNSISLSRVSFLFSKVLLAHPEKQISNEASKSLMGSPDIKHDRMRRFFVNPDAR